MTQLTTLPPPFELTATGLLIRGAPNAVECTECLFTLAKIRNGLQLAIGDLAVYMELHHADAYNSLAEQFDVVGGTVQNYATVARAIPLSSRHESLSYTHHVMAANVKDADTREALLNTAANRGLTTRQFEAEVKSAIGYEQRDYQPIDVRDYFDDETLDRLANLETPHAMRVCSALAKYLREVKPKPI